MDPIKVDFTNKGTKEKSIVIPPEKSKLKMLINIIGTVIIAAVAFYLMLPPMNFKATEFYTYIAIVIVGFLAMVFITSGAMRQPEYMPYVKRVALVPGALLGVLLLVVVVGYAISSPLFRAQTYSEILQVDVEGKFATEIQQQDADSFTNIPRLDESAAIRVSQRALTELSAAGYISQFKVSTNNTQINYKGTPVRVMPLEYDSIIKWFNQRKTGLPGYVIVDMTTNSSKYVAIEDGGMMYSPSEHFGRLLARQLRFQYPTYMLDTPTFEIDEEGNPFWISARLDKTVGLFGGRDVIGAILTDRNGVCTEYSIEEIRTNKDLQWIDRVFSATLLMEQFNYYGKYRQGFWNSVLTQDNVQVTTEGFNYIALNDDVYMYTGVTSVTATDNSIVGFVMINQRTKEATFYSITQGANETAAQGSAKGLVQDQGYTPTFPILINVGGQPTYFMSLKDDSQIVQRYALVNVKDFSSIKVQAESISEVMDLYTEALRKAGIQVEDLNVSEDPTTNEEDPAKETPKEAVAEGVVSTVLSQVINGNTQYYFQLDGKGTFYNISAATSNAAVLVKNGDRIKITYTGEAKTITQATKMEIVTEEATTE